MTNLLKPIEPPSGGLEALRRRLDAEPTRLRQRTRARQLTWAAAVVLLVSGAAVSPVGPYRVTLFDSHAVVPATAPAASELVLDAASHPGLVAMGVVAPADCPVTVMQPNQELVAVQKVSADDDVVFYMVASMSGAERLSREPIVR